MLVAVPAGYILTSNGRFIRGGPSLIALEPGLELRSDGQIIPTGPRFEGETGLAIQPLPNSWPPPRK